MKVELALLALTSYLEHSGCCLANHNVHKVSKIFSHTIFFSRSYSCDVPPKYGSKPMKYSGPKQKLDGMSHWAS